MTRRRHDRGVLWVTLAVSAAAHVAISFPLRDYLSQFLFSAPRAAPPVRVVALSPEQWSQNVRTSGPKPAFPRAERAPLASAPPVEPSGAEAPPSPSPSPEPKADIPTGQIVDVPPTADDSPNPDARFTAKYNTHVEKETSAALDKRERTLGRVTNKLQLEGEDAEAAVRRPPPTTKKGDDRLVDREATPAEQKMVLKVPEILRQDGLDLPQFPGGGTTVAKRRTISAVKGEGRELDVQRGEAPDDKPSEAGGTAGTRDGTGDRTAPALSVLMPNLGTLDRITGSPREADVDGVEQGDGTFLNAKEFKFATFFLRVRDAVADEWEGSLMREYRKRDPMGTIYGTRDRITTLSVTLRPSGDLADVQVADTSGVDFIDNVAIDAFKKAQPFPNPPSAIVDEDGYIRIMFTFKLAVGAQSPFQFRGFQPSQ